MPLSWNEIKTRAVAFTNEWKDEVSEDAEAKSFWDDFFLIFDIRRRRIATFEHHVKQLNNKDGFIDLFWPATLIVEHKSKGRSLDKAHGQVLDYFSGIPDKQLPQYILVSDFARFRLYDLDNNDVHEFPIEKLVDNIGLFGFIAGYQKRSYKEQDPVNIEAAGLMGKLHDKLKAIGYTGHFLELYLVRLLFCLFADDTNIFDKGILLDYIDLRTNEDGSDLANHLAQLFEVLNTSKDKRYTNLDEDLNAFPYVNGKLFEEHLPTASFDSEMRKLLLACCVLDWGKISPAIFGSLFQSVMNPAERRTLGAHYTSEKNILKLIKPLFLDDLWKEFEKLKDSRPKLQKFHDRLRELRFLDPACGCGNFLIIAYRELRLLEIEVIKILLKENITKKLSITNIDIFFLLDVDQFYGIEYEEFPAQIAQVAMWLIDHQMNMKASETFGEYYVRLPLRKSATIKHGNALRIEWQSLIDPIPFEKGEPRFNYILGNPPFNGAMWLTDEQRKDIDLVFGDHKGAGTLDYVTAWYIKAAQYVKTYNVTEKNENTEPSLRGAKQSQLTVCGFVSTNSITQGEQVGIIWPVLQNEFNIKIHFAYRTFKWSNEAKGNAAVHVVIIGFSNYDIAQKHLYSYDNISGDPSLQTVTNINAYLLGGKDIFIKNRKDPISNVPRMVWGNQPRDGGNLLMDQDEKNQLVNQEPLAKKFLRKFIGGYELVNNKARYCLWLKDASPNELKTLPLVLKRIEGVKNFRLASKASSTRKFAQTPTLFAQIAQPDSDYLALPEVSSERRLYIPIGFIRKEVIASNKIQLIPNGTLWHFGILTSTMHMAWMRQVCGRMKSDYSYSNSIVYNNFPWPENPTDKQKQTVEVAAKNVLDVRGRFPDANLADLYDPNTMPPELVKAHQSLDKAVDLCYRPQPFINETKRIEFLFELYDKITSGMFGKEKKGKGKEKEKRDHSL